VPDHDRLFKELLGVFFLDFVELFAPDLAEHIAPKSFELLDKEIFADLIAGKRHVVDLLARVRLRAGRSRRSAAYVLIHVETQAQPARDFARAAQEPPARAVRRRAPRPARARLPVPRRTAQPDGLEEIPDLLTYPRPGMSGSEG
jgi:hypothetical protein